ncbi:filamentous hemagglutinin N-terminal domain-containing protein [Limnoraphis robusta CCNP1324]|uniref:two-partner secretion domain-containing protein n=1 Tax=Limnoraphis robusta TaxID=1118279 RepID=UPI002B211820|nr:filamentous hemagglutinin N-terminal domain-containing protein [Limnoraphis robusta]MEA5546974.1 filamentous hemagglutinin N-terminal domain-containing protein [Limnoraphis robusta CCNP1324]
MNLLKFPCLPTILPTSVALATLYSVINILPTSAQIVPDNSLGNENSVVTPNVNIRGINSDRIDGGAVRGSNLFHSFQEFNIREGRGAYFSNPDNIINILTRVTGGNISEILGTLGVLGNANLFLINPAGIVFGPNARLDVGGSFFATTADGILFENGFEFAASNPQAPPLLTINMPLGLNIRENPGTIINQTLPQLVDRNGIIPNGIPSGLYVPPEETIALIGGEIRFEGGRITSPGSRLELGGLAEPGIVELNPDGSFNFPLNVQRANIILTNGAVASVVGNPGGNIAINVRNLEISGGSQVTNGVAEVSSLPSLIGEENLDAEPSQAGDILINATESIRLTGGNNGIRNIVFPNALGNAGNIDIQTNLLSVSNGAQILTSTFGNGDGGNLTVTANDVELVGSGSQLAASVQRVATGNGGTLTVGTQRLSVREGADIFTGTFGNGDGGNLTVTANDVELVGGGSLLSASVGPGATGNGGTLTLDTQRLSVRDGAQILTSTFGNGDGGDLTVTANDVELVGGGSVLAASVEQGATGNGGTLTLNTQRLSVREGAFISTAIFGNGDGGNLTVTANDVELVGGGSQLGASVVQGATGNGGTLTVDTQRLSVRDGAQISTGTFGNGDGGNLTVTATDVELVGSGSALGASVQRGATGNGGTLTVDTQRLSVRDGAQIGTGTFGNGNGGNLTVTANDVELVGSGSALGASVQRGATGNGGTLTLNTQRLSVREGAQIGTDTFGNGDGGNITVTANDVEVIGTTADGQFPSGLFASVQPGATGKGGTLTLNTQRLSVRDGAQIQTGTRGIGDGGNLTVTATDVELVGGSQLGASVQPEATGNGGTLTLDTQRLSVREGAQIFTGTFGNGDGADLTVTATDVELIGTSADGQLPSALSASALFTSTGRAGTLTVNAENLTVRDGATIDVRSESSEPAGNLVINAPFILLNNQASLNANTTAGQGNIIVNTNDLRLRNNSNITTNATGEATGGNIVLNANTLVAIENSDISANAQQAFGGQVIVNANAIFGTQFRQQATNASDITATSELGPQFSGTVNLNTEIDPSSGLVDLPQRVVDPAALIAQDPCKLGRNSSFIITGRGGIAFNPTQDLFAVPELELSLIEPVTPSVNRSSQRRQQQTKKRDNNPIDSRTIVPARGWIRDEKGDVILVGYDPTKTGVQRQPQPLPNQCNSEE